MIRAIAWNEWKSDDDDEEEDDDDLPPAGGGGCKVTDHCRVLRNHRRRSAK